MKMTEGIQKSDFKILQKSTLVIEVPWDFLFIVFLLFSAKGKVGFLLWFQIIISKSLELEAYWQISYLFSMIQVQHSDNLICYIFTFNIIFSAQYWIYIALK